MSSKTKTSRKAKNPRPKAPEPIITRTKSRQLKNQEDKKTEKPELTKPEIKSTKVNKTVKRPQVSLLKVPDKESETDVDKEQVEYYPNTIKRDVTTKKIMLTPKHNFKVIGATNKRKLATPQKGIKSPPSKHSSPQNGSKSLKRSKISTRPSSSPELSMQDMVRMMEETRSLSDEDFMEILTCPSPVWWEDPPDGGFVEDSIHTRSSEPPPEKIIKETKKNKVTENKKSSKSNNNNMTTIIEHVATCDAQPKVIENKKDEGFVQKKQKLEHILGNIKNKTIRIKHEVKHDIETNRKLSESEGDFSDLSFNEEEILKNLENMDIPIEQSLTDPNDLLLNNKSEIKDIKIKEEAIDIHENEIVTPKNDKVDREILTIEIKSEIKEEFSIKSSVFYKDSIPNTSSEFKSDVSLDEISSNSDKKSDDIIIVDNCTNSDLSNNYDSSSLIDLDNSFNSDKGKNEISKKKSSSVDVANISNMVNNNEIVHNKKTKDLSEFITVYKITPDKFKIENNPDYEIKQAENTKINKLDTVRGKLNDFFKQCKSTIRLKKTEKPSPAIPVTEVKERAENEKENGGTKIDLEDNKNRLKNCNYCIEKIENGMTDFSCEKCELAPILPCGLCNFLADTKEVYRKHVSSCKDVARISWSHNYVLNQT